MTLPVSLLFSYYSKVHIYWACVGVSAHSHGPPCAAHTLTTSRSRPHSSSPHSTQNCTSLSNKVASRTILARYLRYNMTARHATVSSGDTSLWPRRTRNRFKKSTGVQALASVVARLAGRGRRRCGESLQCLYARMGGRSSPWNWGSCGRSSTFESGALQRTWGAHVVGRPHIPYEANA